MLVRDLEGTEGRESCARRANSQDFEELVTDSLERVLPAPMLGWVEVHLAECPNCPICLEQMRLTIRVLGGLDTGTVSPENKESLVRLFRHRSGG